MANRVPRSGSTSRRDDQYQDTSAARLGFLTTLFSGSMLATAIGVLLIVLLLSPVNALKHANYR